MAALAAAGTAQGHASAAPIAPLAASGASATPVLTWTTAHPPATPPSLAYASAAYDSDTATVVLFGGATDKGGLSNDTWVWNGTTWAVYPGTDVHAPPAREMAAMAFDPLLHQLILFGGQGAGGTLLSDTWAWNGYSWYELAQGATDSPPARQAASLAYDRSGNLVLFGGTGYSTQPASGPAPDTSTTSSPSTEASSTTVPAATPTPAPAEKVLGDTWQWTSGGWVQSAASGPSPRSGAAMAYDPVSQTTVLYSGETTPTASPSPQTAPDTWAWNGLSWSREATKSSPPARFGAVMAAVPGAGGLVLAGGEGSSGALADQWIWKPSGWTRPSVAGGFGPRVGAAGDFDSSAGTMVIFGGIGLGGAGLSDTELMSVVIPSPTVPQPAPSTTPTTAGKQPATTIHPPARARTSPTTKAARGRPGISVQAPPSTVAPVVPEPLEASRYRLRPGGAVVLSGAGFEPGAAITITFHSTPAVVGSAHADAGGRFSLTVGVPQAAAAGDHHFVATGTGASGRPAELVAAVVVVANPRTGRPSAAVTAIMLALALLIPAGTWLGLAARDRLGRRAAG